jgi:outer membrane receptor protein involved in Fe transport
MSGLIRTTACCLLLLPLQAYSATSLLNEIVVTAVKSEQKLGDTASSISVISQAELTRINHTHITEALARVPGVWISRGNGQEHLTAIRSPVLTGAGSCGAFVMAQDGISLRSPGFCNVNELFEATTEFASRIEVIRGPGSSIYGSNALHGVINVLTDNPSAQLKSISIEAGPYDYYRSKLSLSSDSLRLDFSGTTDGGYKDDSGFDQQKLLLKHHWADGVKEITTTFSYTNLNQETAGFIRGDEVYKDSGSKRDNPNPEAYRDARSYRLVTEIVQQLDKGEITIKPYLRSVDMTFLQHFLPGQAIEENGHDSIGLLALWHNESWWRLGFELEYTEGFLKETQPNPTTGSAFLEATIPQGKHYDYEVAASLAGLFVEFERDLSDRFKFTGSIRYQYTNYDYDNRMLDGRTRDDGTECGFGGCRFSRPGDREDSFNNWSPKLGFIYDWSSDHQVFGSISHGFRAPQATELYRLQAEQSVADIDPVEMDSIELGFRGTRDDFNYNITLFAMEKENFIFRDTTRQNVDNGETSHRGIELDLGATLTESLSASLAFTFAQHEYENNPALSNSPLKGNEIDTAPETLGSARLHWQPSSRHSLELEWVHIGDYFEDPQNQREYEGHDLLHLRGDWSLSNDVLLYFRVMNLTDEDYAERADYSFGSDRYFVGTPRSLFVGITLDL